LNGFRRFTEEVLACLLFLQFFGKPDTEKMESKEPTSRTGVKVNSVFPQCHSGYVFCLTSSSLPEDAATEMLFSGSGDGTVKVLHLSFSLHFFFFSSSTQLLLHLFIL